MKNQKEFFVVVVVRAVAKQPKYQQLIKAKFVPNSAKVMKKMPSFYATNPTSELHLLC